MRRMHDQASRAPRIIITQATGGANALQSEAVEYFIAAPAPKQHQQQHQQQQQQLSTVQVR